MKVRLTLLRPEGGERHVEVEADVTATVGDVASALATGGSGRSVPDQTGTATLMITDPATGQRRTLLPSATLIESRLQSGVYVAVGRFDHEGHEQPAAAALVRVVSGPDRDIEVPIPPGTSLVGRHPTAAVRLQDGSVSARHLEIVVGGRIEVVDHNSANGIRVGGVRVARAVLDPGQPVQLGSTELIVIPLRTLSDVSSTDLAFTRSPVVLLRPKIRVIELPEPPTATQRQPFPLLAVIAPLVMGVALFAFTRSVLSVLFIGLSPLLMIGTWLTQRLEYRHQLKSAIAEFDRAIAQAKAEHAAQQNFDRTSLLALYPSVGECIEAATARDHRLWMRRPEAPESLRLRLGLGTIASPARLQLRSDRGLPTQLAAARTAAAESVLLEHAPVVADLLESGCIGVTGAQEVASGVVSSLVLQAATLHSPAELVITCLTSTRGRARWTWLEWLPHCSSPHSPVTAPQLCADDAVGGLQLDALEGIVDARLTAADATTIRGPLAGSATDGQERPRPLIPWILTVVDDTTVDRARLTRLAERGPDAGVFLVWVAEQRADIPAACRSFLELSNPSAPEVGHVRRETTVTPVRVESIDLDTAGAVARAIAPVVDAGSPIDDDSDLPRDVSVISLLGRDVSDDPQALLARWRQNRSLVVRNSPPVPMEQSEGLRAVVGHAGSEPFVIDFRTHGPHALVGGTTGAGKSEFLQAWVLGLAHAYSPDRVTFLFIDYKGGSAFAQCADLPHSVGMFSDLSPYLVRRALRSLGAEIHHRERVLNAKRKKDLIDLELTGDPDCPPSLIIVIDEFAALKREIPEFMTGMIDIGQRGRSLGLHLVLATQRPAGVIDDNLRANTNLRIALRLADDADSVDVVGDKVAARFSPARPGRAVAKTGPGRLTPFQAGYPGAKTPALPPTPPIQIRELNFGAGRAWPMPAQAQVDRGLDTDAVRVVRTIRAAAEQAGIPVPRRPWLPSLAEVYDLSRLNPRRDNHVVLGVVDQPDQQQQTREYFLPDTDGNIAYFGASGSGKSNALRSLALAMSISPSGGPVHVYALDFAGGGLRMLEPMPSVGSIVAGDDVERVERLLRYLSELTSARNDTFGAADAGTLTEYRQLANRPDEPRVLLLIDGFETFRRDFEDRRGAQETYEGFQRLIVDGRARGVHVAVSVDRPMGIPPAVLAAFGRRIVLRQADNDAYAQLGVPKEMLSASSPPGRAVESGRGLELQLAILGTSHATAEQARAIARLAPTVARLVRVPPPEIQRLPTNLSAAGFPRVEGGRPVLGMAGRSLAPLAFDPNGVMLIVGPTQSGRSNALAWITETLLSARPDLRLIRLAATETRLGRSPVWTSSISDVEEIEKLLPELNELFRKPAEDRLPSVMVVEGLTDFSATDVVNTLVELIRICRRTGQLLIVEAETTAFRDSESYDLRKAAVDSARSTLVLQPQTDDGEYFAKTAFPYGFGQFPVGRAYWTTGGVIQVVQIPEVG